MTLVIIIARCLGPKNNGTYSIIILFPTILSTLFNLGVSSSNVYFIASKRVSLTTAFKTSLFWTLVMSVFGAFSTYIFFSYKASSIFPGVPLVLLWLGFVFFPVSLALTYCQSLLLGLQNFKEYNFSLLVSPAASLILILFLVYFFNYGVIGAVVSIILGNIISLIVGLFFLKENLIVKQVQKPNLSIFEFIPQSLKYGIKAHLSNIIAILNYRIDIFFINYFLGPLYTGIYVIAVQISERIWMVSHSVGVVIFPKLSEIASDTEQIRLLTPRIFRLVLLLSTLLSLLVALLSFPLIYYVFGSSYLESLGPLFLLLPGIILLSVSRVLANDISARGKPELNLYSSFLVLLINIVLNISLIPSLGINGAAIASSVSYSLNAIIKTWQYSYLSKNPWYYPYLITKEDIIKLKANIKLFKNQYFRNNPSNVTELTIETKSNQ